MVGFWLVEVQFDQRNSLMQPVHEFSMSKPYIVLSELIKTWVAQLFLQHSCIG